MSHDLFDNYQSFDTTAVNKSIVESLKSEVATYSYQHVQSVIIDKSLAVSCLHKAIRRGDAVHAQMYAKRILELDADYLFRRLPIIAYEDIGIANTQLCTFAVVANSKVLRNLIGESKLAYYLVESMAKSNKSRTATDIFCLTISDPCADKYMKCCLNMSDEELVKTTLDDSLILTHRMTALRVISGMSEIQPNGYTKCIRKPRFDLLERVCDEMQLPGSILNLTLLGHNKTAGLNAAMLLAFETLMNAPYARYMKSKIHSDMHKNINLSALDVYCTNGRSVIAKFVITNKPLKQYFVKHSIKNPAKLIGAALFIVEGSLLTNEYKFTGSPEIKSEIEFYEMKVLGVKTDANANELINLLKQEMPALQKIRIDFINEITDMISDTRLHLT